MAPPADLHQDDAINGQAELDVEDLKGHSMLAPFTAGWQMKASQQLIIERSEGVYVYDNVGKKYLDALAGLWSTALGGHEKRLVDAAVRQLNVLPFYHSFWNRTTSPSLELAKELLKFFEAEDMARVFFTNSGSEANDTQIKIVRFYNNALGRPQKKKIIARNKAYHGSTIASASLSGLPTLHKGFDLPEPFALHTDCPHYWRYHLPGESEEEYSTRLADNLEKLILKEGPDTVAAFIAEPVMGAGGVIPPPSTYFDKIQVILKRYDVLFIVDEVICAFGRLGTMFGCEMYNITPDLVSVAKALSSAYMPIGAVLVSHHVADAVLDHSSTLGSFGHGFTYSGHPVACAVALEALRMYKEIDITAHVQRVAPLFQDGIRGFVSSPIIGEIRGVGLIMGVEFTDEKSPDKLFPAGWDVAGFFAERSTEGGMLVRVVGNAICMSPPLIITEAEVRELVCIFGKSLKSTEEYVKQRKKDAVL